MSFDLKINLQTGDLEWDSKRDLASCQAEELIQQRIHVRLMVHRGTFIYDVAGTLGSRLYTLLGLGIPQSESSIAMVVREALEPMTDISIIDITVDSPEHPGDSPIVHISYQLVLTDASTDSSSEGSSVLTSSFLLPV